MLGAGITTTPRMREPRRVLPPAVIRVARAAGWSVLGSVFVKIAWLGLLALVGRQFGAVGLATLTVVTATGLAMTSLITQSMGWLLTREMASGRLTAKRLRVDLLASLGIGLIGAGFLVAISGRLAENVLDQPSWQPLIAISATGVLAGCLSTPAGAVLEGAMAFRTQAIGESIGASTTLALGVWAILTNSVELLILAVSVGQVASAVVLLVAATRVPLMMVKSPVDSNVRPHRARSGLAWLVVGNGAGQLGWILVPILSLRTLGPETTGYITSALALRALCVFLPAGLQQVALPVFTRGLIDDEAHQSQRLLIGAHLSSLIAASSAILVILVLPDLYVALFGISLRHDLAVALLVAGAVVQVAGLPLFSMLISRGCVRSMSIGAIAGASSVLTLPSAIELLGSPAVGVVVLAFSATAGGVWLVALRLQGVLGIRQLALNVVALQILCLLVACIAGRFALPGLTLAGLLSVASICVSAALLWRQARGTPLDLSE